jgi:hypothetical protein
MSTCNDRTIITQNVKDFTDDTLDRLFELYKNTYSSANQVLWFAEKKTF